MRRIQALQPLSRAHIIIIIIVSLCLRLSLPRSPTRARAPLPSTREIPPHTALHRFSNRARAGAPPRIIAHASNHTIVSTPPRARGASTTDARAVSRAWYFHPSTHRLHRARATSRRVHPASPRWARVSATPPRWERMGGWMGAVDRVCVVVPASRVSHIAVPLPRLHLALVRRRRPPSRARYHPRAHRLDASPPRSTPPPVAHCGRPQGRPFDRCEAVGRTPRPVAIGRWDDARSRFGSGDRIG